MSNPISLDAYQAQAVETAVYPEVGTGSQLALAYLGLGLGEAGEVQGKIKKILRDDAGTVTDEARNALVAELGDVLWYVAVLADELYVDLSTIALRNLDKLADRKQRGVLGGSGDDR